MDKKRRLGLVILLASLLLFLLLTNLSLGNDRLDKHVISLEKAAEIKASRQDKAFDDLTIKLDGNACFLEKSKDTYYYSLIKERKSSMNPLVDVAGKDSGLKVSFIDKALAKESIEKNEPLEMLVYNDRYFHIYRLVSTTLPIMNLECKQEICEEESKMVMTLYDNRSNSASRVIESDGFVRFRGATTLYYPKKGLKISLTQRSPGNNRRNNDISLLGMRQDDDWILYAAYNDQEKIRNVFSHNLWEYSCAKDNKKNIDAGMEYKYLELFINGEYSGLYAIGSPIDEMQMELSGNVKKDALYKSIYWSNVDGIMMPVNTVTGFETKSAPKILKNGQLNEDGTISVKGSPYTYIDNSAWNLFLDYSYYLEKNRHDSGKLMEAIDLDNAIDFYLFMTLIQGMDTTMGYQAKNYYFSVSKEGNKLSSLYLPWDMDISWGNYWTGDLDINFTIPYGINAKENYLFEQGYLNQIIVNNDTDIARKIFSKYEKLRKGAWSEENILKLLDKYEKDIYGSGAFIRDKERWPDGHYNLAGEGLGRFKEYVLERLTETDAYMARLQADFDKSILVRRSTQYENFKECNFFIAINDPKILKDKDYLDLFEYIGIDTSVLNQSTTMILHNSKDKKTECLINPIEDGFEYDSVIGNISMGRREGGFYFTDDDFEIDLNGRYLYDTLSIYEPAIRFYFIDGKTSKTMDFSKDYELDIMVSTFNDLKLYLKALNMFDYEVTIEYGRNDFLKDEEIASYIEAFNDKVSTIVNKEISGVKIEVKDIISGQLIDKVYYEYVLETTNAQRVIRTINCIRE